ncbi:MAG: RNA polymerase-associated protein RapA [Dehalococcoidia bacterium]|nr:RNA polymerase-associated protein RapA [Chloroflexota bacterium]
MRRYQSAASSFIRETKKCALFIEPGLGKTVTTLTAIRDMADDLELGRVLVVGPPRVAKSVWPDEIREWAHTRDMTFTNIDGTPSKRLRQLTQATSVHLISHDLVPWLDDLIGHNHEYDMIVVDESSRFKNHSTKRWAAMRRLVRRARYVVLLTGTPASNGLHDLWAQVYLLDQGARLGSTITAFRERWFEQNWGQSVYRPKDFTADSIHTRIEDICFTLREADYGDLPPRIDNYVKVELTDELRKQYRRFQREYVLELADGTDLKAVSAVALTNKLLQLANGVVYDTDKKERFFHKLKVDALEEVIDGANGQPVFVAYNFKSDVRAIKERFPHAVVMGNNPQTIIDWNEGRIQLLVAHPKSAGHGLNLQHGGSTAVWYGLTYSLEDYLQFNKRLHRKGQTRTTVIHHLVCAGTVDEDVIDALRSKDQMQNNLLNALKRRINEAIDG